MNDKPVKITIEYKGATETIECDVFLGSAMKHVSADEFPTDIQVSPIVIGNISYLDALRCMSALNKTLYDVFVTPKCEVVK